MQGSQGVGQVLQGGHGQQGPHGLQSGKQGLHGEHGEHGKQGDGQGLQGKQNGGQQGGQHGGQHRGSHGGQLGGHSGLGGLSGQLDGGQGAGQGGEEDIVVTLFRCCSREPMQKKTKEFTRACIILSSQEFAYFKLTRACIFQVHKSLHISSSHELALF